MITPTAKTNNDYDSQTPYFYTQLTPSKSLELLKLSDEETWIVKLLQNRPLVSLPSTTTGIAKNFKTRKIHKEGPFQVGQQRPNFTMPRSIITSPSELMPPPIRIPARQKLTHSAEPSVPENLPIVAPSIICHSLQSLKTDLDSVSSRIESKNY